MNKILFPKLYYYNYKISFMTLISKIKIDRKKVLIKFLSYAVSGFSIVFISYILIETLSNYPPKLMGISP